MGSVYPRGNRLWLAYKDANGKRVLKPTGLALDQRAEALRLLDAIERVVDAEKNLGVIIEGDTVGAYKKHWLHKREKLGLGSVKDERNWLKHAAELDDLRLVDVRPRHARDLVAGLKARKVLAPRSILHVYRTLRQMFRHAAQDGLLSGNPIDVEKRDLPKKRDKDLSWRASAVFTRDEVERLISSSELPEERRTLYALLFLTGCRIGEVTDRRWRDHEEREPLDCLHVHSSWHSKTRKTKAVKTEVARLVPVHRTLAGILAEWRLGGWERTFGRAPKPEDLILPGPDGRTQKHSTSVWERFLVDLEKLGIRPRRVHDTRRTFVTLARADGARLDLLQLITHGPSGSIIDAYSTIPWATLCAEVARVKVRRVATSKLHGANKHA